MTQKRLTASNMKYLLAVHEGYHPERGVRCIDVASRLHVTRPSVHTMMNTLSAMGLIRKDPYGTVFFTEEGKTVSARYSVYFQVICRHFDRLLPEEPDRRAAACALLAEIPLETVEDMCRRMEAPSSVR